MAQSHSDNLWQSHMSDDEAEVPDLDRPGDYSSRMEELFDDGEESSTDDEEFLYTGVDADTSTGYRDQLRDILGPEAEVDEDSNDDVKTSFADQSLTAEPALNEEVKNANHPLVEEQILLSDSDDAGSAAHRKPPRPFLHPSVSRLRSYAPGYISSTPSDLSFASVPTPPGELSFSSNFSSLSHESSPIIANGATLDDIKAHTAKEREVFRWAELGSISHYLYPSRSQKSNAVLGTLSPSRPTALASNGMICVGTESGSVHVFDFRQTLKCVCGADVNGMQTISALDYWKTSINIGPPAKEKRVGPVTALALSHDHTYVASGHSTGHIFLYNLSEPNVPARSLPPTTLSAIVSGRKEGHLHGSRIVNVGFIGGRHTAIVSADEHGLAFYHNLGKVLFVEAFDTLRILGRYPEEERLTNGHAPSSTQKGKKSKFTVLALSPLPLGTSPHVTDNYQVIAMLTPTKLVVVGLRPSPKTWFKYPRGTDEGTIIESSSKRRGNLAWFPSTVQQARNSVNGSTDSTDPMLVYNWSNSIHLIKVMERRTKQVIREGQKGKVKELEIGIIVYEDICKWFTKEDVLSLQWLNGNQIAAFTSTSLGVYDAHQGAIIEYIPFDATNLVKSPSPSIPRGDPLKKSLAVVDVVAHSVRVYKGKIFLLCQDKVQVGTLLTWADQILSCVQAGDFLGAIEVCRSYYMDEAPGNRNGLPIDPEERRNVIGERMRHLMNASAQYAFSEERLTDDTHVTPDHRGVDLTSLFENLVVICCRACIALDDFEFLYEDLFQQYDDAAIARIYLMNLQPFILDNSLRYVPPRITQRLIALHEGDGRSDEIERIIWHIDPACLDINQAIHLCQIYHLYDALIYIYTCALHDYVAPIVEFLAIIRQKLHADRKVDAKDNVNQQLFQHAYKVFPYLEAILTGNIYPSNAPLEEIESLQAKKDVFLFLSSGSSCVWPRTGGQLVLTSLEEGGEEPTYPYVRQLLVFDSEWFLHSLDKAFEKAFLDDELQYRCQSITRMLVEIVSSHLLQPSDATFVRIFIARNAPKYPQFLHIPAHDLHSILVSLAEDRDPETREDRQLAAESLLSIYHPDDLDNILRLFTEAGFYRILRQRYLQDCQWSALLTTYLDDTSLEASEIISGINETLSVAQKPNRGKLPSELMIMLESRLSDILAIDVEKAALLVDKYQPNLHDHAVGLLDDDFRRFQYLQHLLVRDHLTSTSDTSRTVSKHLYHMYLSLQCRFEPKRVINVLNTLPLDMLGWDQVLRICESSGVYEAVLWALNGRGEPQGAVAKAETYLKQLISKALDQDRDENLPNILDTTRSVIHMGITICLEHSSGEETLTFQPEDLWLRLFKSQIYSIQMASGIPPGGLENGVQTLLLPSLRSLVQETFGSLVSATSGKTVSFPRLFKRLVESVSSSTGAHYTEFRSILTGMLESYRSDGDILVITKHLVERDLFDTTAAFARERGKGWSPSAITCFYCRKPAHRNPGLTDDIAESLDDLHYQVVVSRTGNLYHVHCSPPS